MRWMNTQTFCLCRLWGCADSWSANRDRDDANPSVPNIFEQLFGDDDAVPLPPAPKKPADLGVSRADQMGQGQELGQSTGCGIGIQGMLDEMFGSSQSSADPTTLNQPQPSRIGRKRSHSTAQLKAKKAKTASGGSSIRFIRWWQARQGRQRR